mgnify:CR=1 FL=1
MKLDVWLRKHGRGEIERLARSAGVSRGAVKAGARGELCDVAVAKALEAATKGQVTVAELTHAVEAKRA